MRRQIHSQHKLSSKYSLNRVQPLGSLFRACQKAELDQRRIRQALAKKQTKLDVNTTGKGRTCRTTWSMTRGMLLPMFTRIQVVGTLEANESDASKHLTERR